MGIGTTEAEARSVAGNEVEEARINAALVLSAFAAEAEPAAPVKGAGLGVTERGETEPRPGHR